MTPYDETGKPEFYVSGPGNYRDDMTLARAYVPHQKPGGKMYHPEEALKKGTVYPELYRGYNPCEGSNREVCKGE